MWNTTGKRNKMIKSIYRHSFVRSWIKLQEVQRIPNLTQKVITWNLEQVKVFKSFYRNWQWEFDGNYIKMQNILQKLLKHNELAIQLLQNHFLMSETTGWEWKWQTPNIHTVRLAAVHHYWTIFTMHLAPSNTFNRWHLIYPKTKQKTLLTVYSKLIQIGAP